MHYKEFRTAAHRHLMSCEKMCEKLTDMKNASEKREFISEIYYLSGYIVETLLSYAIFSVADRNIQNNPIETHPDYDNGFKTHDFQAKIHFALRHGCSFNGIPFIGMRHPNENLRRMFNGWRIDMRYRHHSKFQNVPVNLDDQMIITYIVELSKLERLINQKYI